MSDRARRDRLKSKKRRERTARAVDVASADNSNNATVTQHTSQIASLQAAVQRVKGRRTSNQFIANTAATFVDFDAADDFDVTAWHDHTSATLNVRESFTVPSGAGGTYVVVAHVAFAAPLLAGAFLLEVTVGGTPIPDVVREYVAATQAPAFHLTAVLALVAADVLKVRVTQTSGLALNLSSATFAIARVA